MYLTKLKNKKLIAILILMTMVITQIAPNVIIAKTKDSKKESYVKYDDGTTGTVDLSSCSISLSKTSYKYNGLSHEPDVSVTGPDGTEYYSYDDFDISYYDNIDAGTASVVISGEGSTLTGTVTKTFTIKKAKISSSAIYSEDRVYNGKKRSPKLNIYYYAYDDSGDYSNSYVLKKGRDYKITKNGNKKKIGKYKCKIKFIGNYTGTKKKTWRINPRAVRKVKGKKNSRNKTITVRWKKPKCPVSYYVVEYWNGKKNVRKKTKAKHFTVRKPKGSDSATLYIYACKKVKGKQMLSNYKYYWNAFKPGKPKFKVTKGFGRLDVTMKAWGYYQAKYTYKNSYGIKQKRTYRFNGSSFYLCGFESGTKIKLKVRRYVYDRKNKILMGKWSKTKSYRVY